MTNRAAEFGNVNLTFKGLVVRGSEINVAAGFGLSLPTGPDAIVRGAGGSELLRINNDSWIVTPYVAALFTPDERLFAQVWAQVGFDTTGSPVLFNPGQSGLTGVGRLHDQTLFSTDLQVGYWMIRNPHGAGLRGLAPFVELHYNTPLNDAEAIQAGGLTITSLNNRYDEVNLTLGVAALINDNLLVSAGFVTPLRSAGPVLRLSVRAAGQLALWTSGADGRICRNARDRAAPGRDDAGRDARTDGAARGSARTSRPKPAPSLPARSIRTSSAIRSGFPERIAEQSRPECPSSRATSV